ncbi:MAG: cell division protein FtsA [SAR202 cluster bacterium]|nr:cell division protein FtsA [SAR202 cluster bacterium]
MAGRNDYIASIDIGTDKIAVLVAEKEEEKLRIIGNNIFPSDGVRKGSISAIDPLSRAISKIVDQTQKSFDLDIALVRVNLSDTHLTCIDGYGKVPIREVVTSDDIDKVLETASAIPTPTNKEKLHTIKKKFIIDEDHIVDNPEGMQAEVLESKVHIVTVSSVSMRNIENCLKKCDLMVDDIVLDPIANSEAILTQEEKDGGVCLIDFGAGVTSYSVFQEEGIIRSGVISMGGDDVTQEIAFAFDTSLEEAKRLKEDYGHAKSSVIKDEQFVEFVQAANKDPHYLSSLQLSEVIEEAYLNILSTLKNELRHHNLEVNIKSGFVLCGGGAQALGCEKLVREFFTRRVKIGVVQRDRVSGLETILMDYRYTGSIGLLLYQEDLPQVDFIMTKGRNGVMGKIKEVLVGNF